MKISTQLVLIGCCIAMTLGCHMVMETESLGWITLAVGYGGKVVFPILGALLLYSFLFTPRCWACTRTRSGEYCVCGERLP